MSILSNKSGLNIEAARLLNAHSYYPSAIHCSYYSCVQLMKHIIIHALGKSETIISTEMKVKNIRTHDYLIQEINLNLKNNSKDWKTFYTNISQLKKLRVDSDYGEISIDSTAGINSVTLSDLIIKQLKANFKI